MAIHLKGKHKVQSSSGFFIELAYSQRFFITSDKYSLIFSPIASKKSLKIVVFFCRCNNYIYIT